MIIKLPANSAEPDGIWHPRPHQRAGWDYLLRGGRRLIEVDHRRGGKDDLAMAWTCTAAHNRVGNYWHLLPLQTQCRKAIWGAVDPIKGKRRIDLHFPPELRTKTIDHDMRIEFHNASTWQLVGSDSYNSLVGSSPAGLVFSEFALADPQAWAYLRPILAENSGWAVFISTPRGRNALYKMFQHALKPDNDWLAVMNKADETGVFTPEQLEVERQEYIALYGESLGEAMYSQEYLVSWEGVWPGAYWSQALNDLERDGRLCHVPYDENLLVHTSFDLGLNDACVIWYTQLMGAQWRLIDVDVYRNTGLAEIIRDVKRKPYQYGNHAFPHDLRVRDIGSGQSRERLVMDLKLYPTICPNHKVHDGIDAVRRMIPKLLVDREKCGDAFEILKSYRATWDDLTQTLSKTPLHDHSSNFADSLRYRVMTTFAVPGDWGEIDYSELDRAAG